MRSFVVISCVWLFLHLAVNNCIAGSLQADQYASKPLNPAHFENPPAEYDPAILWFWHDRDMTEDVIKSQLKDMRDAGFSEIMLFPLASRPQWYTEEWFKAIGQVLEEAKRNKMHIWLFNDNHCPSGRGANYVVKGGKLGNRVLQCHPEWEPMQLQQSIVEINSTGPVHIKSIWPGLGSLARDMTTGKDQVCAKGSVIGNTGVNWSDYAISVDVQPLVADTHMENVGKYQHAGIIFRAADLDNCAAWVLRTYPYQGKGTYLVKMAFKDGKIVRYEPVKLSASIEPERFYHVRIKLDGKKVETSIDGKVVDTDQHDTTLPNGTVGFYQSSFEQAFYKNLEVVSNDGKVLYKNSFDTTLADITFFAPRLKPETVVAVSAIPVQDGNAQLQAAVDLSAEFRDDKVWQAPKGKFRIEYFSGIYIRNFAGESYLDLTNTDAVKAYIDIIHNELKNRFPWAVGTVLRGLWDDEPAVPQCQGYIPWSLDFPERLARSGYKSAQVLPAVFGEYGRAGRIAKGAFWKCAVDGWADPWYREQGSWAQQNGMSLISNPVNDDAGPDGAIQGGDLLKDNQWFQVPGIDVIYNQIEPGKRSLNPRWATSAAHQNGRSQVLYEIMGGYGWRVAPADVRYITGYVEVRGANLGVYHAYWANPKSVEYAPPFNPVNPWWSCVPEMNKWVARLTTLTSGKSNARTALFAPMRSVETWHGCAKGIDESFTKAAYLLEDNQVDFDFVDESSLDGDAAMKIQAEVDGDALTVGQQSYHTIVLPYVPTMSLEAADRLIKLVRKGGVVLALDGLPCEETKGRDSQLRSKLGELFGVDPQNIKSSRKMYGKGWTALCLSQQELVNKLTEAGAPSIQISPANDQIRVLTRQHGKDIVYVLMNESNEPAKMTAQFPVSGTPELWDPDSGAHKPVLNFRCTNKSTSLPLALESSSCLAVVFRSDLPAPEKFAHLTTCDLNALSLSVVDKHQIKAEFIADKVGHFQLIANYRSMQYKGVLHIDSLPESLKLNDGWRYRFLNDPNWHELPALLNLAQIKPDYSGVAEYSSQFNVKTFSGNKLWELELGQVANAVEVEINGISAGKVLWEPYKINISKLIKPGLNNIKIKVINTLANAHNDIRPWGLMGPVYLRPFNVETVILKNE